MRAPFRRLVVATGNAGKLAEISAVLADCGVELVPQSSLGLPDADETGTTFVENALIKARQASAATGMPALADDSGLMIDALDGRPGLIAAHYAGVLHDSAGNIAKVLRELDGVPAALRSARFCSIVVVVRSPDDAQPLIAEGEWHGRILEAPRGDGGFGYDPIFFDPVLGMSAAEL
ncbi:MAG TPA: non-canonical purine NTP pyrophosphatase, partial [Candidatus Saccharimonadia bacterium]|nr:non-canonical purine NTP pyrophosphatase [Candidatus Saccharimonadia bacterium]